MDNQNLLITNANLVTSEGPLPATVLVRDGRIAKVRKTATGERGSTLPVFDAGGLWLLPGGVDAHVHFGMPLPDGVTSLGPRASSTAALLGGTTTVIDFANPRPEESLRGALDRWHESFAGECLCDYGLHVTVGEVNRDVLAELPHLVQDGYPTFKAFLAYKDRLMLTPADLERLMKAVADCGGRLLLHAEDGESNARAEAALIAAGRTGPRWHPSAHPAQSEIAAVETGVRLALATGCPLTVVHLSLAESIDCVRRARQQAGAAAGLLSAEACLHHLFAGSGHCANREADFLRLTMSPPVRGPHDSRALLTALAAGDIDLLSTDHCEFSLAVKTAAATRGFPAIPNGTGGVGERLALSHSLAVATGDLDPARWLDVVCRRPAELMGLAGRKGRIAPGYDADLVLFDPDAEYSWQPLGESDPEVSLYTGRPCKGAVRHVWLRGTQVVKDGRLQKKLLAGGALRREYR